MDQGYDAYERGDIDMAILIWQELALEGNATAQLNLGQIYRLGQGVEQDDEEAVKWYIMAARNGSEIASVTLVQMEQDGRASKADVAAAFPGSEGTLEDSLSSLADAAPAAPPTPPESAAAEPASAPETEPAPVTAPAPALIVASAPVQTPTSVPPPTSVPKAAAPAKEATAPVPDAPPAVTVAAATPPKAAVAATPLPQSSRARIKPLPRGAYVIQLLASANKAALENYARQKLDGVRDKQKILFTRRGTKTEYLLMLGPYISQTAAERAVTRLPSAVQQGMPWVGGQPWVRTTDSVMRIAHYMPE